MSATENYSRMSCAGREFAGFITRGGRHGGTNKFGFKVKKCTGSIIEHMDRHPRDPKPKQDPDPTIEFDEPPKIVEKLVPPPQQQPQPSPSKPELKLPKEVEKTPQKSPPMVKKLSPWKFPISIPPRLASSENWPSLDFPGGFEDPEHSHSLAKAHFKFHPSDALEETKESEITTRLSVYSRNPDYDAKFSEEVGDMGSDEARFEAAELIEYKDRSWCIAVPISTEKTSDKMGFMLFNYSYQRGVDRVTLSIEEFENLRGSLLIKYRRDRNNLEIVPIYSALPSTGLMSLKYRHNKGIELRVYGLVSFIDFVKDHTNMSHRTLVWTDALGPIYLTAADRSNIRRKLMTDEEKAFAPLRMVQMTVKGDFNTTVPNGTIPKWQVMSLQPIVEESGKDPNIGRNLWPARVLRFDDLIMQKPPTADNECWFQSHSDPERVLVNACPALFGIINSAGPEYARNGVMSGIVVPVFIRNQFAYYEALIIGPLRVVMLITEGRALNYYPKTWPPSIEARQRLYREESQKKYKEWKSMQPEQRNRPTGSIEFNF